MSSHSLDVVKEHIRRVQRRRHRMFTMRHVCLGLAFLVALFMMLAFLEITLQLPLAGRLTLLGILCLGAVIVCLWYLHVSRQIHIDERRMAHYVEDHIPELEQRLITSMEVDNLGKQDGSSPLIERLWQDTRQQLQARNLVQVGSVRAVWPSAAAAALMIGCLLLALWHWSDFSRASRRLILPWTETAGDMTFAGTLTVEPGDITIPRGHDVMLIATLEHAAPTQVHVNLQSDEGHWTRVPMTREGDSTTYVYVLSTVQQDVTYYVDMGVPRSDQYHIGVFDLPRVEQIAVTYAYPPYTGIPNQTVKNQGDIIAPEGTRITLHTTFNTPVDRARLVFGDGTTVPLNTHGTEATGSFTVTKNSTYTMQLTDTAHRENDHPYEYMVRAIPDRPPVLTQLMPGGDRRVMPLEEVSIAATARDDYGLQQFVLHYSITGGENRQVTFLQEPIQQLDLTVAGQTVLYLEDLGVEPGDVITYYMTVADNNAIQGPSEITSDIYFLQVSPTHETFRRASQLGGGGGGAGGQSPSSALVENQKQIIAATWKLVRKQPGMSPEQFAEHVQTILASQRQVKQRTQLSLSRLLERFSFSDASYDRAVEHLKQAVAHMEAATEQLAAEQVQDALGPEQLALRAIMKAESESRQTMIQMARNSGGFGGHNGMNREREDLQELFEMEMGRLENRYELPQRGGGHEPGAEQEDILEKLRRLANRQERLNRSQRDLARRQEHMTEAQQKRRLEELRRQQEELSREAQNLSQRMSQLARHESLRHWSDRQQQVQQAARQMQEASRSLQRQKPQSAAAQSQQAFEHLRRQEQEMSLQRQATVTDLRRDLQTKARALQAMEQQVLNDLHELTRPKDHTDAKAEANVVEGVNEVIERKDAMVRQLAEAKTMLQKIGKAAQQDHPDIAARAFDTLGSLQAEGLERRIEESQQILQEGWLSRSMEVEERIEQAINRVSARLQELDHRAPDSRQEQLQQAAADATRLRRELEALQQHVEALRQGNRQRMQQSLQRSRQYARGLTQPWARDEGWSVDARSIERELTQREIDDFLSQPDLWSKLLAPVKELEAAIRAQTQASQITKKLFSARDQEVPAPYRHQVEEYYRELSREPERP